MIATCSFINWTLAIRALCDARVYVVKQETCLSRNLASCFVIGVSTLEACLKATGADSSPLTNATWPSDCTLTAWSSAPFELVRFSNSDIFLYHVVLLLNLR